MSINAPSVPQGRRGWVRITPTSGSAIVLPAANVRAPAPRNLVSPIPMGRSAQYAHKEGFRTGAFSAQIFIDDNANRALSTAFLDLFFTRTNDNLNTCKIEYDSGGQLKTLEGCMGHQLGLSYGKGDILSFQTTFLAPAPPTPAAHATPPAMTSSSWLSFKEITFTGVTVPIYSFEMSLSNGLLVNAPIWDGTSNIGVVAKGYDAGVISAGCTFLLKDGVSSSDFLDPNTNAFTMVITGSNVTRTFSFANVVPADQDSVEASIGQVFKSLPCMCEATDAYDYPIRYS